MDKEKFKDAADNFRRQVGALKSSVQMLEAVEQLIVEDEEAGDIMPDATIEQNAELSLREIAEKIDEVTGGYDYLLDTLGFSPRYGKPRR